MRKTICFLLLTIGSFLFCGGCFASDSIITIAKQCDSGAKVTLTLEAQELVTFKPIKANLSVLGSDNKPVDSAIVFCSIYMPNYATGSNKPAFKQNGNAGEYTSTIFFSQAGKWKIDLTVNFPDGNHEEVSFDIDKVTLGPS